MNYHKTIYYVAMVHYCNEDNIVGKTGVSNDLDRLVAWASDSPRMHTEYERSLLVSELCDFENETRVTYSI